jgi:DNA-binding response OmpR family regulator
MTKPFSLRELIARIRAMLRRAYGDYAVQEGQDNILHVSELTILLDTTQVKLGSNLLNLTPTEYRLLVYLARQAGKSVSRKQILAEVWDDPYGVESERTVNVHIRRLREKIEIDPGKPRLILTVPGVGYRLVTD